MDHTVSRFSPEPNPSEPGTNAWSLKQVSINLLLSPRKVVHQIHQGQVHPHQALVLALVYIVCASVLFSLTVILDPTAWNFPLWQLVVRFLLTFIVSLVFMIPLITAVWAVLQRLSAWFWDIRLPWLETLAYAGLGVFYYDLMLAFSLPIFVFGGSYIFLFQGLLFLLNISAFILSIRLFKNVYQEVGAVSAKRAVWVATFPLILVLGVQLLTQLLTYLAVLPQFRGR
jgi:hypothetical protein